MMLRRILVIAFSVLLIAATASAEDYDYMSEYSFLATPVVKYNKSGEFDHRIYYFAFGNNKCLVFISHGSGDNSRYSIWIDGQRRYDYAQAVAETIAYWTRQGQLRNVGNFNYVFLHTCYTGYAPEHTNLPIYNIDLQKAIDHKGVNYFIEIPLNNGQVILDFGRCIPKNSNAGYVSGGLSNFLKRNGVRGYRSTGTRSSSKPKGAIIVSGDIF